MRLHLHLKRHFMHHHLILCPIWGFTTPTPIDIHVQTPIISIGTTRRSPKRKQTPKWARLLLVNRSPSRKSGHKEVVVRMGEPSNLYILPLLLDGVVLTHGSDEHVFKSDPIVSHFHNSLGRISLRSCEFILELHYQHYCIWMHYIHDPIAVPFQLEFLLARLPLVQIMGWCGHMWQFLVIWVSCANFGLFGPHL